MSETKKLAARIREAVEAHEIEIERAARKAVESLQNETGVSVLGVEVEVSPRTSAGGTPSQIVGVKIEVEL